MIDWRAFREQFRGDWVIKWFFVPVSGIMAALILWQNGLGDLLLAITNSKRWAMLTNTPEGLGIISGFTGLIITTAAGFHFTNRQRQEDARLARESREEQAKLDRKRDAKLRNEEAHALAAALRSELVVALITAVTFNKRTDKIIAGIEEMNAKDRDSERAFMVRPPFITPIFSANCGKIGLLGEGLAQELARTFDGLSVFARLINATWTTQTNADALPSLTASRDTIEGVMKRIRRSIKLVDAFIERGAYSPNKSHLPDS